MHPNPAFRPDAATLLAAAERIGFARIFAATADGPMVVHAPVTVHEGTPRFHVARGNRITRHLDGAAVTIGLCATDGYVSPNWYAVPGDQVPTWNAVTVGIDGIARAIDAEALTEHLDRLAAVHEPRDDPWHRAKMDPAALRGTTKLSQNKSSADRAGMIAALRRAGNDAMAERMVRGD